MQLQVSAHTHGLLQPRADQQTVRSQGVFLVTLFNLYHVSQFPCSKAAKTPFPECSQPGEHRSLRQESRVARPPAALVIVVSYSHALSLS